MIHHGDLFDVLPTLPAESIHACVTDPPYGIGFMGKKWDTFKPGEAERRLVPNKGRDSDNPNLKGRTRGPASSPSAVEYDYSVTALRGFQDWTAQWAREVYRVLRPGAYIIVCGAPRSHHRMMSGLEDAGFEIRDCLAWLFGQGFPKSLNFPDGWGTALKPAHEPIALARKPFTGSVGKNRERHGTGAVNINGCRIPASPGDIGPRVDGAVRVPRSSEIWCNDDGSFDLPRNFHEHPLGRWPANVCLDESAAAMLDEQSGELTSGTAHVLRRGGTTGRGMGYGSSAAGNVDGSALYGDTGGASRFYYVAKPSRAERDLGCEGLAARSGGEATGRVDGSAGTQSPRAGAGRTGGAKNIHPTVKPVELMRWLVRLVTPPGGTVLDPFTGSGTTGMACAYEGVPFIGVEREAEYVAIAERRIAACLPLLRDVEQTA